MARERHHNALPSGYKLHWYVIGTVIGKGGFGITYLALDTNLDQRVAIKEFLPVELATRSDNSHVHPISEDHSDTYGWGLDRFVTEARTLARFRHPNVVRVMSVFEANSTAYMVMEYERGESFEKVLKAGKITSEAKLRSLVMPLLDGLKVVHEAGFIHRDIKPDNIYLRESGTPVLLDFGSARRAIGVATRTLTALVTPGYAPFEQYDTSTAGEKKQGPWTDIYSLGATLYRAITGSGPPDAMGRVNAVMGGTDILKPASEAASGDYSPGFLAAIDWALEFLPENRPQSVDQWRVVLAGRATRPAPTVVANVTTDFARARAHRGSHPDRRSHQHRRQCRPRHNRPPLGHRLREIRCASLVQEVRWSVAHAQGRRHRRLGRHRPHRASGTTQGQWRPGAKTSCRRKPQSPHCGSGNRSADLRRHGRMVFSYPAISSASPTKSRRRGG